MQVLPKIKEFQILRTYSASLLWNKFVQLVKINLKNRTLTIKRRNKMGKQYPSEITREQFEKI